MNVGGVRFCACDKLRASGVGMYLVVGDVDFLKHGCCGAFFRRLANCSCPWRMELYVPPRERREKKRENWSATQDFHQVSSEGAEAAARAKLYSSTCASKRVWVNESRYINSDHSETCANFT